MAAGDARPSKCCLVYPGCPLAALGSGTHPLADDGRFQVRLAEQAQARQRGQLAAADVPLLRAQSENRLVVSMTFSTNQELLMAPGLSDGCCP